MSFNGSGVFVISTSGQPVVTMTTITSTAFNALTADLANGLSTCITKDGQSTPTANIGLGGFKITNLANGTLATDAVAFGQLSSFGVPGYTTTATAAGSTTLTVLSTYDQFFTGVTTQTVVLPVTGTLALGFKFHIQNNSSGVVTVNSSGGNAVVAMVPLSSVIVTCILTSGTTAASWDIEYTGKSAVTGTGAFVLATSPTIATPIINSAAHVGGTWVADATWTLPAFTLGGTVTATGQEITSPVLNTAVAKGTWTTSGTWTLPAFTLGGTVTMNGQTISGAVVFNNALSGITTLNASGLVTASSGITFGGSTLSTYVGPTSFTPGLTFGGGATGMTGTFTGRYQRLGGTVTFCAQISLSAKGSSTGTATITGLPVASSTIAAPYSLVYTFIDVNVGGGDYVVQANTSPGNTTIDIFQTGDNVDVVSLTHANFADNTLLRIQGSYFVA